MRPYNFGGFDNGWTVRMQFEYALKLRIWVFLVFVGLFSGLGLVLLYVGLVLYVTAAARNDYN